MLGASYVRVWVVVLDQGKGNLSMQSRAKRDGACRSE